MPTTAGSPAICARVASSMSRASAGRGIAACRAHVTKRALASAAIAASVIHGPAEEPAPRDEDQSAAEAGRPANRCERIADHRGPAEPARDRAHENGSHAEG